MRKGCGQGEVPVKDAYVIKRKYFLPRDQYFPLIHSRSQIPAFSNRIAPNKAAEKPAFARPPVPAPNFFRRAVWQVNSSRRYDWRRVIVGMRKPTSRHYVYGKSTWRYCETQTPICCANWSHAGFLERERARPFAASSAPTRILAMTGAAGRRLAAHGEAPILCAFSIPALQPRLTPA